MFTTINASEKPALLVVYEKPASKYEQIYSDIFEGIRNNPNVNPQFISVDIDIPKSLTDSVRNTPHDAMITLGQNLTTRINDINHRSPVISCGNINYTNDKFQVTYTPSPSLMLEKLYQINPNIKNIYTVSSRPKNDPLIAEMQNVAIELQFNLKIVFASDTNTALMSYQSIIDNIDNSTDAIWLQADRITSHEDTIVTMILRTAWRKKLVVFSSKPLHARKGALFSAYPDHIGMGNQLASLASYAVDTSLANIQTKQTLAHLVFALNKRTAAHLGIDANKLTENFPLIFPTTN